ncbi:MAG: restriction endonuclease subunit S [Bacteroidales bacterium]|jgi:type I restriction enzyme S subunit|nr:restriction endonuclease subunit S [Bacteroidales bacterium]
MVEVINEIEKLIEELCPEGVEFNSIQELLYKKNISTVSPPKKLTKKYYKNNGLIPIIDQGQKFIVGYTNDKNIAVSKGKYVIFGDHTEAIKYVDFAFVQGADGIKILETNSISTKYLYYSLNNFYKKTGKYTRHFSFLKKTKIPIPPLPIQEKIVKILDNFTELEAELEAELKARRQQYEYYRGKLLTFKEVEKNDKQ